MNAARERGKSIRCISNLKQLDLARTMYSSDFQDWIYPCQGMATGSPSWQTMFGKNHLQYIPTSTVYRCPSEPKYFTEPEYVGLLKELRAAGGKIALYSCDTSMRLDLYKYYITHAWRALAFGTDGCDLYEFMTHRNAIADWKRSTCGSTAIMASGHPVSTIRLECLRIGSTDIKYMKKLAEVLKNADGADAALRSEAEKFLKEIPMRAGMTMLHDPGFTAAAREQAIDLILKLLKSRP